MDEVNFRPWHYLTRNAETSNPQTVVSFDVEPMSYPHPEDRKKRILIFRTAHVWVSRMDKGKITRTHDYPATTIAAFWGQLAALGDHKHPLWIFAHGLGFDLTVTRFWEELDAGTYRLADWVDPRRRDNPESSKKYRPFKGFAVLEDPPTILITKRGRVKCTFCDSQNYWRVTLDQLAQSLGRERIPFNADKASREDWQERCRDNAGIVHQAITQLMAWQHSEDMGHFAYTTPGIAWRAFRHRFMPVTPLIHGNLAVCNLERKAYYGGEVQVCYARKIKPAPELFPSGRADDKKGKAFSRFGPVHLVDVNSLYPSVMEKHTFPMRLKGWVPMMSHYQLEQMAKRWGLVAEVEIRSAHDTYPVRHDGMRISARGTFATTLAGPELLRALNAGHLASIGVTAWYECQDLFGPFVRHFYDLKRAAVAGGDHVAAHFAKLILNGLYGKFAQLTSPWEDVDDMIAPIPWGHFAHRVFGDELTTVLRVIAGRVQAQVKRQEASHSFPAIAAFVTAHARERLRQLREIAGQNHVFYMDTDSLHVDTVGLTNLQKVSDHFGEGLGQLRLVATAPYAHYYGLKNYRFGTERIVSGITLDRELKGEHEFDSPRCQRLPSILDTKPNGTVTMTLGSSSTATNRFPGTVRADGWVEPPILGTLPASPRSRAPTQPLQPIGVH